ncbi:MAG: type 1 glutamine amidotransferase [Candidatus Binataceae bacterium]
MAKIIVLQHHPAENLGAIAQALESAALAWQYVRLHDDHAVPKDMKGAGGLIVMGGPMAVYQTGRFPSLKDEMRLIEDAIKQGRPVLGVCLGAQIVAAALGAKVEKNPAGKEIGWARVRLSPAAREDRLFSGIAETITPFHWHGDHFELPAGAIALASSDKTPCQAFRYGEKAWALQFHLEVTRTGIENMANAFARDLDREKISRNKMLAESDTHLPALETIGETIFNRWAAPIQGT